ncbi:MAG: signal recognition particle protein [Candidatus Cloacimonetes bacterium]|nr:signal recognition particle protein [Candidatus Cloacimonadota bacterium]
MFGELTERLEGVFKKLRGQGKLSEKNIQESLREVRRALLEADVNFKIAKKFVKDVQERAVGQEVMKSLTPGHQVVKIVHEELIALMGGKAERISLPDNRLNKIMLVGLQGSGKTTACAKLSQLFRKRGNNPALVACDVYRPAAVHQLEVLGKQLDIPVVSSGSKDVLAIAQQAVAYGEKHMHDLLIFDTAGRLHIDTDMMREVEELRTYLKPDYIFFVADAMTGQDAVNVATEFHERLDFHGVILTKMDGDARGGAALSIKATTGRPIVFVGTGEKPGDIEEFAPERMASRILGMGDVLTLIERAEEAMDVEKAEDLAKRLKKNQFTFNDFLDQLEQVRKMGPLDQLMGMMPGAGKALKGLKLDEKEIKHVEAIIFSMSAEERERPEIIKGQRRQRIAKGSGTSVQAVNRLLKQFDQMKKMLRQFSSGKMGKGKMALPFG